MAFKDKVSNKYQIQLISLSFGPMLPLWFKNHIKGFVLQTDFNILATWCDRNDMYISGT